MAMYLQSIAVSWHNIQKHNYYYMYVLYINNVSVILHRVSSSIHTVAYMYNCIAVSVSRVRVS